jgi:glycosyltransferase involved in cell wall biosynthesis
MKLSVIVPVYNEKRTIEVILDKVRRSPVEKEIIVVDGNSEDGTKEILREQRKYKNTTVIFQKKRNGRGGALKEGIKVTTGDIVIFQDADLEVDPDDYPRLIKPIEEGKADVVFGSRFLEDKPKMRFLQYWGNYILNLMVNIFYNQKLTDVETCYQVFKREIIKDIEMKNNDFAFTIELTIKLIKAGYKILEIPISYIPRGRAEGKKIYWKDGFVSIWTILKYKFFK